MAESLNLGLDLGSDTLKIAYAFQEEYGIEYGKLTRNDSLTQVAIPAVAYYDEAAKKWLYGDQVDRVESSFVNVVKIKNLVSLLQKNEDGEVFSRNRDFYYNRNQFPKFYFPVRRKMLEDFGKMAEGDMTFTAEGFTPRSVCEGFFAYAREIAARRMGELVRARGLSYGELRVAVVYPPKVGKEYIYELVRLTAGAFGSPCKVLSSTKALGMFAYHRGALRMGEGALVFDMGDEDISVAKAWLQGERLVIDGADGHSEPLPLGGTDVDEAVLSYIEEGIRARETVGTPSYGEAGHIFERGLHAKQYLLMKNIKRAKIVLSRPLRHDSAFINGVPVAVARDLYIQRNIDREAFVDCVGIASGGGVADAVASYVEEELKLPSNRDVKKIFFSGGLTETYALLEYVKGRLAAVAPEVEVGTFDDNRDSGDGYTILSHEDSVYAPAVGGAIVALCDYEVKTALALSYGTWAIDKTTAKKTFVMLANKGTLLDDDGNFFKEKFHVSGQYVAGDEMFSAAISAEEIEEREIAGLEYLANGKLVVGEEESQPRRKAQLLAGLKRVAGGKDAKILFYYKGERVALFREISFYEGIAIDGDGRATPVIQNCSDNRFVMVRVLNSGRMTEVPASAIELRFDGVDKFTVVAGE